MFYHPKERANVEDIVRICSALGCEVLVIPRTGSKGPVCSLAKCVDNIMEAMDYVAKCKVIALETCGSEEALLKASNEPCLSVILGAEDYGLPKEVIELVKKMGGYIARIPMSGYGVSYNVVTSLILLLTEIEVLKRDAETR